MNHLKQLQLIHSPHMINRTEPLMQNIVKSRHSRLCSKPYKGLLRVGDWQRHLLVRVATMRCVFILNTQGRPS